MKAIIFSILLLFLVVSALTTPAQSTFNRVYYEPDGYNYGKGIVEVDSSLIVSVWRRQQFPEIIMLKLNDDDGDVLIEKNYGNSEDSLGWFIHGNDEFKKITDSLFILSGSIGRYEDGFYYVRYGHMKLFNEELDTIWTTIVKNDYDSTVYFSTASTFSETDFYMCGQFFYAPSILSDPNGITKSFITKFDLEGNIVWNKTYLFQNGFEAVLDIETVGDELITYGGQSYPNDFSILRRYSSDGVVLDSLGWTYQGNFTNLSAVRNNKFAFFLNFYPLKILKYNTELEEEFNYEYNISDGEQFPRDIEWDNNGNIIACGAGYDDEIDNFMGYIIKLDSLGNLIWNRRIFYYTEDIALQQFNSVIQTQDGGYAACGQNNSAGGIHSQLWVVKTDSMGCIVPGCDSLDNSINDLNLSNQQNWFTFGPNPVSSQDGLLNIYLGHQSQNNLQTRKLTFKITNLQGQIIKEFEAKSFGITYMVPINGIASGSYVLSLQNGSQVFQSSKIIIE